MNQQEQIAVAVSLSKAAAEAISVCGTSTAMRTLGERLAEAAKQQLNLAIPQEEAAKVLTDADALADLNGAPRPDNPSIAAMPPHQQRVLDEAQELDGRIEKLGIFLDCVTFETLPQDEQQRMSLQLSIMKQLSQVLHERIAEF